MTGWLRWLGFGVETDELIHGTDSVACEHVIMEVGLQIAEESRFFYVIFGTIISHALKKTIKINPFLSPVP